MNSVSISLNIYNRNIIKTQLFALNRDKNCKNKVHI